MSGDAIGLELDRLTEKPAPFMIILRVRMPAIIQTPKGGAVLDNPVQFEAESCEQCGNGWVFWLKERDPDTGGLSTYRLTVRTEDIAYVRVQVPDLKR